MEANTTPNYSYSQKPRAYYARFLNVVLLLGALASTRQSAALEFPDALVAHWAFDEMSGLQVKDSSTNCLNGTLTGGEWTFAGSELDGALKFSGGGQAVFFPADGQPAPDKIADLTQGTIVLRFRFAATTNGLINPVFCMGQRTADRPEQFTLIVEVGHANNPDNRKVYFTIINSGLCFDTGENLLPDTWYHYAAVVGPGGNTGYLNGQELINRHYNLGSNPTYTNFFSSVPNRECLTVGCGRYAGDFLYGQSSVSDLQIYNRPLTAEEIRRLYLDTMDPALFKIDGPTFASDGNGFNLTWPSDANYVYSVLQKDEPGKDWQPVPELEQLPATPPVNTAYIPLEEAPMRLFRVIASPKVL